MMRATFGVQLKGRKRVENLMLMLSINIVIDQLAMAIIVHCSGYVLMRQDLSSELHISFTVKGQGRID